MSARKLMFWGSEQILHSLTQINSIDGQRSWLKLGRDAQTVVVKLWRGLNLLCHKRSPDSIMHARFQEGNQMHTIHDRPKLTCQPQWCRLLITRSLKFTPSNQILLVREGQSVLGCRFLFHISDHEGWGGGGGGWDDAGTTEKAFAAEGQIDADVVTAHYLRHAWRWDLWSGSGNMTISVCVIAAVSPDTYWAQQFNHTAWENSGFPKVNLHVQIIQFFLWFRQQRTP